MAYIPSRSDYEFLKHKKCFVFDIDGTVAWGTRPIPEARDFILRLRATDRRVIFYTNNPNRSHEQAAAYLNEMGFETCPEEILSSEDVAFAYLRKQADDEVLVIANMGDGPVELPLSEEWTDFFAEEHCRERVAVSSREVKILI
jgi:ribonucleotide monophosphatase NagD (HAD superfamily)